MPIGQLNLVVNHILDGEKLLMHYLWYRYCVACTQPYEQIWRIFRPYLPTRVILRVATFKPTFQPSKFAPTLIILIKSTSKRISRQLGSSRWCFLKSDKFARLVNFSTDLMLLRWLIGGFRSTIYSYYDNASILRRSILDYSIRAGSYTVLTDFQL